MRASLIVTLAFSNLVQALDLTTITHFLSQSADTEFPTLKAMGQDIYDNPELGRAELHAHDLAVTHFSSLRGCSFQWFVMAAVLLFLMLLIGYRYMKQK